MYYYIRYQTCDGYIVQYEEGRLQTQPGCSAEETLEVGVAAVDATIGQFFTGSDLKRVISDQRCHRKVMSPEVTIY